MCKNVMQVTSWSTPSMTQELISTETAEPVIKKINEQGMSLAMQVELYNYFMWVNYQIFFKKKQNEKERTLYLGQQTPDH